MILLLSGPDLPTKIWGLSMVASANGVLAIGGRDFDNGWIELKSIYRMSCNEENNCQWIQEGELNYARFTSSVIPITPELDRKSTPISILLLQPVIDMISVIISLFNKT